MPIECRKITNIMEKIAPSYLAEDWDNVGLQIGRLNKQINKILVCLEVNSEITKEAIDKKVDMIISHHPLIFKPLKKIVSSDPIANIAMQLVKNDINLYSAHTNLDIAKGGTSDYLAELLGLKALEPLTITYRKKYYKLVIFVPKEKVNEVRDAISTAGAGHIGNYSHCTFQGVGEGTFKPLEGSNPYIGSVDKLEMVNEYRLETIVPQDKLNKVLNAMLKSHPYEEVAYDIIPLKNEYEPQGFGRIGYFHKPITLKELSELLKEKLNSELVKYVGVKDKLIKKVAICTGSGADFIKDAVKTGCDCYITGDIKYHEAQYAKELGIAIIDAGHYETESIIATPLRNYLIDEINKRGYDVEVIKTEKDINPFSIL